MTMVKSLSIIHNFLINILMACYEREKMIVGTFPSSVLIDQKRSCVINHYAEHAQKHGNGDVTCVFPARSHAFIHTKYRALLNYCETFLNIKLVFAISY